MKKTLYYFILVCAVMSVMKAHLAYALPSTVYNAEPTINPNATPTPPKQVTVCKEPPCTPLEMEQWSSCRARALCARNVCLEDALRNIISNIGFTVPLVCQCAIIQALAGIWYTCEQSPDPETCLRDGVASLFINATMCGLETDLGLIISAIFLAARNLEFQLAKERCYLEFIHDEKLCVPGCASRPGDYDDDSNASSCAPPPNSGAACTPPRCP